MYKTISNAIIRKFQPCYDPSKFITDETEELTVKEWVEKYRKVIPAKDIIWLLSREEFMSEKDLILFVVWCAREALKLIENPDKRSVEACNVAEKYANGEATKEELLSAHDAAYDAVDIATSNAASAAANAAYIADDVAVYDKADIAYAVAHAASTAAFYAASTAAFYAASTAAFYAAYNAARDAQLEQLLTYFE
jgi:hypothetical protein